MEPLNTLLSAATEALTPAAGHNLLQLLERFKADFGFSYREYREACQRQYGSVRTLLKQGAAMPVRQFFEPPFLLSGSREVLCDHVRNVLELGHFLFFQAPGGAGKSVFLKYLLLDALDQGDLIPVFLDLSLLNGREDCDLFQLILDQLTSPGKTPDSKLLDYSLTGGYFLFLMDGYDELAPARQTEFARTLDSFCSRYGDNYFFVASRPLEELRELPAFTPVALQPFTYKQACSMIRRLDYDEDVKARFLEMLEANLYLRHRDFASNPLLLTLLLLVFEQKPELPAKRFLFYENAFDVLYHRRSRGGSPHGALASGLDSVDFQQVLSALCALMYAKNLLACPRPELLQLLSSVRENTGIDFSPDDFLADLIGPVGLMLRDGLDFRFIHRSFQEYFAALYLSRQPDDAMARLSRKLLENNGRRVARDLVFDLLCELCKDRYEQNVLLPALEASEADWDGGDRYAYYLRKFPFWFSYRPAREKNSIGVFRSQQYYVSRSPMDTLVRKAGAARIPDQPFSHEADSEISRYFQEQAELHPGTPASLPAWGAAPGSTLYELIRQSSYSRLHRAAAGLREELLQKRGTCRTDGDLF